MHNFKNTGEKWNLMFKNFITKNFNMRIDYF